MNRKLVVSEATNENFLLQKEKLIIFLIHQTTVAMVMVVIT